MLKYKGIEVYDYKKTYDKYYDFIIKNINEKVDNTVYDYIDCAVKDLVILELKEGYKYFEVDYFDGYDTKTNEPTRVSITKHEAITKQMKELGWIRK